LTLFLQFAQTPPQHLVYSGIIVEAMREHWTDGRMDDLVQRVDNGFVQVDARFAQVDTRFAQVDARFAEVHEDIAALRVDNRELRRDMATLGLGLQGEMATLGNELRSEMSQLATRKELQALNKRFDDLNRTLIAATLTGIIALFASHFG
jgi:hypothetical protein